MRDDDGFDENCTFKMKPSAYCSSQGLDKQQVACGTGSPKCGNWAGLCSGHRFKHAHMLIFYHPPSLLPPFCFHLSPFSSSPVVRIPLLTAPAVCLFFMSNVSVAGSPHKATSIDWKTIQFSLARLAARCGVDLCFFCSV